MQDSTQAMLVALGAVCIGVLFDQLGGTTSFVIRLVGIMLIMGAFIIAVTAFLLTLKEWLLENGS